MPAAPGEMSRALYGAYRLARLDPGGMDFFRNTTGAFWRSFYAALIIAPFHAILLSMRYAVGEITATPATYIAVECVAYIVAWTAFPVIADSLTRAMDRSGRYIRFIIAYNWAAVLQNLLYLPLAMLSVNGLLPPGAAGLIWFMVLILVMGYIWFIAKTALDIPGGRAVGLVAVDFALSFLINAYAERML